MRLGTRTRALTALLSCVTLLAGILPPARARADGALSPAADEATTATGPARSTSPQGAHATTQDTAGRAIPAVASVAVGNAAADQAAARAEAPPAAEEAAAARSSQARAAVAATSGQKAALSQGPASVDSIAVGGGDKTGVSSQAISLPQGAGKIQGMGESFSTQLSTGVATFSVPIALPDARGSAQPSLAIAYNSGGAHGVAGVGWDVGVPSIARQTDRGLPLYGDQSAWYPQQDRFVYGSDELVPICNVQGTSCSGALAGEAMPAWASGWQYFRPRVEGTYSRFFWSPDHKTWRVQSKSGESMELGVPLDGSGDTTGLETDPSNAAHIFRWNLVRQYDNEGAPPPAGAAQPTPANPIVYRYENVGGIDYLTDIYDTPPAAAGATPPSLSQYAHHTRLIYEARPDSTFSYRRGWRVDQTQRLVGIDVASAAFLSSSSARHQVRRYHLTYDPNYHVSLLTSVQLEGRCAGSAAGEGSAPAEDPTSEALPSTTNCSMLPPITLGYQHVAPFNIDGTTGAADLVGYEGFDERLTRMSQSPPNSIDENMTDLFDINSDGLPDVVVTTPGADTKFPLYFNGAGGVPNAFGPSRLGVQGVLGATSSGINLANDNVAVSDIDGDGTIDWLHQPAPQSYAIYTPTLLPGGWFMAGRAIPASANQDPHLDLGEDTPDIDVLDVNGDGLVDVVRATGTEMQTFFSLGRYPGGDGNFGSATWTGPDSAKLSLQFVPSCVPLVASGVPVQFSDSTIRLADMNGDGLQDIVYAQPGDVRYWPGRGDGSFGTGPLGSCTSGFAANTYVTMSDAPNYADTNGTGLRLDDVNGDGLDDLVEIEFDTVQVWLNVDGAGWTPQPHIIQGVTPAQGPNWVSKVRLADINGSGTRDVLWGEGGSYRYMDLSGGERPWLLTHIDNGLGKTTDLGYSTSTAQMLAAQAAGQPWASTSPMPVHVVSSVTERDNLAVAGSSGGVYVTQYTYRDAVYDGRQREFRGFRSTQERHIGDANSPSSTTSSSFLLGDCEDDEPPPPGLTSRCTPQGRWADNPREALKGLPVVNETVDDNGVYLSTHHNQYTLRKLYTGLDGREVRVAFESQGDDWLYDTAAFTPAAALPVVADVVLDGPPGPEPSTPMPLTERATSGTAHTQSTTVVDDFGNTTKKVASGCVDGAACASADDVINAVTTPELVAGDGSGWLWRTLESYVQGSDGVARNDTTYVYDPNGRPTTTTEHVVGSLPLDRFHATGAAHASNTAPNASQDGPIVVSQELYDGFGNVTSQAGADGRCHDMVYASDYADFAISETLYVGSATGGGTCAAGQGAKGSVSLTATAAYDRGLAAITAVVDLHQEPSLVAYDDLGRLVSLTRPSAASQVLSSLPSVQIDYDLAKPGRPYSVIHTANSVGATESDSTYRDTFAYMDGFGRSVVTVSQADPNAGDGGPWIASGLSTYDAKGTPDRGYLATFYGGDPRAFPLGSASTSPSVTQRYDAFGRKLQSYALDGSITEQSAYHALSSDHWDAADLEVGGAHQGTPVTEVHDGHGRTVTVTERVHSGGAIEAHDTRTQYVSTGEPLVITRVRDGANDAPVVRWLRYDTLGRMVLNVEPDATKNFSADPTTSPDALKTWRYAYDDNGDLVGTSDARGCGADYYYDAGGRIVAEDFSPCLASQPTYSTPDPSTGQGTEAFYEYDRLDSSIASIPQFPIDTSMLLGRLVATSDRGAKTVTRFDGRGRVTGMARQLVAPGTPSTDPGTRYAPHWYTHTTTFDDADREVSATTGVDSDISPLLDANGQSVVSTTYSMRDAVASVSSGYGRIIAKVVRDADGLIAQTVYGDAAQTTSALSYDGRRRLSSKQVYRGAPAIWSQPPAGYSPTPNATPPTTFQLLLDDADYHYDTVDNPIEIDDWRNPSEWPAGAQPVTRKWQYDDLYRATQVAYVYPGGTDGWTSPFDAEDRSLDPDPRRGQPEPRVHFATRVQQQSFQYDWLGNTVQTDDDEHGFYDRSLGTVTNGTASSGPYQLRAAVDGDPTLGGTVNAAYDDAGNLTGLAATRKGPCLPANAVCSQRLAYDWDEVGRMVRARRWDLRSPGDPADPTLPTAQPDADLAYAYDVHDDRTLKTATDSSGNAVYDAYVFDSLELRRSTWNTTDYQRTALTEVGYLFAHGARIARLHYDTSSPAVTSASTGALHLLLELPDPMGSTSTVIDAATGELVERGTYMAYGQTESDYRPTRWDSFREDYRFSGKDEDVEVGLQYFGARFYAPLLGRWMSADPLTIHGHASDLNAYAYVHGRLMRAVDVNGLLGVDWSAFRLSNVGQEVKGAYAGAVESAHELKEQVSHPVETFGQIKGALTAAYDKGGVAGVVRTTLVDPIVEGYRAGKAAEQRGDYHEAGRQAWHTAVAIVGAVESGKGALNVGGAAVKVTKALARELPIVVPGVGMGFGGLTVKAGRKAAKDAAKAAVEEVPADPAPRGQVGSVPKPPKGRGAVPPAERDPKRLFTRRETAQKLEEQGGACAGCGAKIDPSEAKGHHVERHADGAPTTPDNLASVCDDCHKEIHK